MLKNFLLIFKTRYLILKQFLFILKIKLKKTKNTNLRNLIDNGYVHIEKCFPVDVIQEIAKKNYSKIDKERVADHIQLDESDKKKIFLNLKKLDIFKICREYLGKKIFCYDNTYQYLGTKKSFENSWQPHHDSKSNRLKIYIWISKKDLNTHPLFYSKGTHKKIKSWLKYEDTRFPKTDLEFDKVYGDTGDVIIFDTHGIHSNFKTSEIERQCFIVTLESYGVFKRINLPSKKGLEELHRLSAEVLNY